MSTGYLLSHLLPLESVQLGRLVLNAKKPHQDYIDPLGQPAEGQFSQSQQIDFEETRKFSKNSKLRSQLKNVLSISFESKNAGTATLSAPIATTYDLHNSGTWFRDACAQSRIRKFLEDAIDDQKNVYLIVGFRTARNARLVQRVAWEKGQQVRGEVSIQSLVPGLTSTNTSLMVASEAGCIRDAGNGQDLIYQTPGEQVFAILYRKVRFKWFSNRGVDNMFLEVGNRWLSCWEWRGAEEEDDEILEAILTDVDDLEISDDEDSANENEINDLGEEPSSLAGSVEEVYGTAEISTKRKGSHSSSAEAKRLRTGPA